MEMFGDEITQISVVDTVTGKILAEKDKVNIYPSKHFVMPYARLEKAHRQASRPSCEETFGAFKRRRQAARGPAARDADELRHRDAARDRLLPRHRKLLPASERQGGGRAAVHADRLFPRRVPARDRRIPRDRAADQGHVRR